MIVKLFQACNKFYARIVKENCMETRIICVF